MVGRNVDKKDEIRVYIQARSKFGCSLKQVITEISTLMDLLVCLLTQFEGWKEIFESGVESIKIAAKSGRPKIVSKIKGNQ